MENQHNFSKSEEAELNLRVVNIMERIGKVKLESEVVVCQDIVAVVGPTKGGKSTLINALLESPLMFKVDKYGDAFIVKASESRGPKIGDINGESETEIPEEYRNVPGINYIVYDFPGVGDTGGPIQEIVNAVRYQKVLRPQHSVRFLLVIPWNLIESRDPKPFYRLLYEVKTICPNIEDSVCIVASQGKDSNVKQGLEKKLSYQPSKAEKREVDIVNKGKVILEKVLEKGTYFDFRAPKLEDNVTEGSFTLPNKEQLIECINKLEGRKVPDFPLVISQEAKLDITDLYTVLFYEVKGEVDNMTSAINQLIQTKIDEIIKARQEDGKQTPAASKHAIFKEQRNVLVYIMQNSKCFEDFFVQAKKSGFIIHQSFLETIEKYNFIEKLYNEYKLKDSEKSYQGKLLFFNNVKVTLRNGIEDYNALITTYESATEEEKRIEREWREYNNDEINALKKQIDDLKKTLETTERNEMKEKKTLKEKINYLEEQQSSSCVLL